MVILILLQAAFADDVLPRLAAMGRDALDGSVVLALALAVFCVGWAVVALVTRLLRALLRAVKFDALAHRLVGPQAIGRHEPSAVAAWAVHWLLLALVALLALETLGVHVAGSVAERLDDVVPRIVTSAALFAVGAVIALLAGGITRRFLASAEVRTARLQGQVVRIVLTGFAALVALEQLGFAAQFVMAIGVVGLGAAGLALALAFGLGCRDLARDFVIEYLRSLEEERPRRPE